MRGLANMKNLAGHDGLDVHEDFVSDASSEQQYYWKKATYEMDQVVADTVFEGDPLKMGLSLYYKEQDGEQKKDF